MDNSRYVRQIAIEGIGVEGQRRIYQGKVMIIGCGALGSVVASYLAGAGVGHLIIADFDTVDISNLQRQVFYHQQDAGKKKVELMATHLKHLNSDVNVIAYDKLISLKNGIDIARNVDFIIDATDNPASKYMTDKLSEESGKPCCIGGVEMMRGQMITILPGDLRYRELFPEMPENPGMTPCSVAGVLGPAAGITASLQAGEALKFLSGCGDLCTGKLLDFDMKTMQFRILEL